jgi:hypothetical protein
MGCQDISILSQVVVGYSIFHPVKFTQTKAMKLVFADSPLILQH